MKKTVIWDTHEPPKDYIWVNNDEVLEYNSSTKEWEESDYDIADLRLGNINKRTMIFDDNTTPPDNYIWNKNGSIYAKSPFVEGNDWEEQKKESGNSEPDVIASDPMPVTPVGDDDVWDGN